MDGAHGLVQCNFLLGGLKRYEHGVCTFAHYMRCFNLREADTKTSRFGEGSRSHRTFEPSREKYPVPSVRTRSWVAQCHRGIASYATTESNGFDFLLMTSSPFVHLRSAHKHLYSTYISAVYTFHHPIV